ncbi:MAG TPA: cyclase family protein [Burkholderiales bacterium]|nr:cyclase family protein [Burkholderiales bacterium]
MENRRDFFKTAGLAAVAAALAGSEVRADGGAHRDDLFKAVKRARIFDLSHTWDENSPIAGVNPPYSMSLTEPGAANHAGTRGMFGDGDQLSFAGEVQHWSGQHGAPSIDAIGHIGQDGLLFHGVNAADSTSDARGIGRSGVGAHLDIAHYPKELLINRAVLLDVARFINRSSAPLAPGYNITGEILADTARHQRVNPRRADTVLIRTGWGQYFAGNPGLYKGDSAAGVGVSGAEYLAKQGAKLVGNDTLTFEVRPPIAFPPETPAFQVFPVHMLLIAQNGIHIIENYDLEEIAAAKEYEFLLVVPPLKIRGGTGSALRSFALVP